MRVYETLASQALAGTDGDDPILEATRRWLPQEGGGGEKFYMLTGALGYVFLADREGQGRDYVLGLFQQSELPPTCRRGYVQQNGPMQGPRQRCPRGSTWCLAGNVLYGGIVYDAQEEHARENGYIRWEGSMFVPPGLPEVAASWLQRCNGRRPRDLRQ